MHGIVIRDARERDEIGVVRAMFEEYAASLDVDLCFQRFDEELAQLPGYYAPPRGCVLLAETGEGIAGCIALRPLASNVLDIGEVRVAGFQPCGLHGVVSVRHRAEQVERDRPEKLSS